MINQIVDRGDFMENPRSKNGKVILFSRQDERSLDMIERKGRFTNSRGNIEEKFEDISKFIIEPYNWFVKEASKLVEKPKDVEYPIWCAVDRLGSLIPRGDTVLYVLEVPEEKVIYFDGTKWDFVLNEHYVPDNAEDLEKYQKELKRKGIDNGYEFIRGSYAHMYPLETERVLDSRIKVFDVDSWNIYSIQGNIWEIKEEWIRKVVRPGEDFTDEDVEEIYKNIE